MFEGWTAGRKTCLVVSRCALFFLLGITGLCLCGCTKGNANHATEILTSRQECLDVPNCTSVEMDVKQLKGTQAALHLKCPAQAPFLWNWDAERYRDVSIKLTEETPYSVLLLITDNNAEDVSTFRIFLGCSPTNVSERTIRFTHVSSSEVNW